jgi:tRNA nucleotidyltransferase/poly(A) polymerase
MDHVGYLSEIFPELDALRGLTQPPPHEFSAWDHTLAVLDHLGKLLFTLGSNHDPEVELELIFGEIVYRLGRFREGINNHLEKELSQGRNIRQLLFFGTLFHDSGKPACYESFEGRIRFHRHEQVGAEIIAEKAAELKLSNTELKWLKLLVRNHLRPAQLERETKLTHRAIYRFLRHTNEAGVGVLLLSLADLLGKGTPPMDQEVLSKRVGTVRQLFTAYFEASSEGYSPPPLLRGDEIVEELNIMPGPVIGRLLLALQEAQVSGEVKSKSDAISFIHSEHKKMIHSKKDGADGGDFF